MHKAFLSKTILFCVSLALIITTWRAIIYEADKHPYYLDECVNTRAAINLIKYLNYTDILRRAYPPYVTTGFGATWPSAVAWLLLINNLFEARIFISFIVWIHFGLIVWFFFRRRNYNPYSIICLISILWALSLRCVFWYGFLLNMGELIGILWIATSILFFSARKGHPYWAALCLGIAVWSCKLIYLPAALVLGVTYFLYDTYKNGKWGVNRFRVAAGLGLMFFLPLLLWMSLIYLKFGYASLEKWCMDLGNYIQSNPTALKRTSISHGLQARSNNPVGEWYRLSAGTQFKILCSTFGACCLGFFNLWLFRNKRKGLGYWFLLGSSIILAVYTQWYFLWDSRMWQRRIQPGMYLGIGVCIYCSVQIIETYLSRQYWSRLIALLALIVLLFQPPQAWRYPLLRPTPTYARLCQEILSVPLSPQP
ncbi:hypothetical protein JXQ70_20285 [bacterium]|nr:hypothetical protein [bacterium]